MGSFSLCIVTVSVQSCARHVSMVGPLCHISPSITTGYKLVRRTQIKIYFTTYNIHKI